MPEVIFADPEGGPFRLTTPDEMFRLMETRGEDYWNNPEGGGFPSLTYRPQGWAEGLPQTARLDFTRKDGHGFHFYYRVSPNRGLPEAYLFSSNGGPLAETIEVNWAGESRKVFAALFVPLDQAMAVVRQFFEDGTPTEVIRWTQCRDVPDID